MAFFNSDKKLAVLESKFDIYENVSKEMLDKLDRAVNTISENSNRVAVILERHEGKLNDSAKTDEIIIQMIDELKTQNSKEHELTKERIEKIEVKIQELSKFRWITVGVATAAVIIIKSADFFGSILKLPNTPLTSQTTHGMMHIVQIPSNVLH